MPLSNITVEVADGRNLLSTEFASTFPITIDQAALPAAGEGGPAGPAAGANVNNASVDPLGLPNPLPLLPPEELPGINFTNIEAPLPPGEPQGEAPTVPTVPPVNGLPTAGTIASVVDEDALPGGIANGPGDIVLSGAQHPTENVDTGGTLPHDFGPDGPERRRVVERQTCSIAAGTP